MREKFLLLIRRRISTKICVLLLISIVSIFSLIFVSDIDTQVTLGPKAPPHFRIHVAVGSKNENTKTIMQSWINREFRKLDDVSIVNFEKAVCILDIPTLEPILLSTGKKSGYIVVGAVFYMRSKTDPRLYYLPNSMVFMDNTKDLEDLCKRIVADIDVRNLQPIREHFQ